MPDLRPVKASSPVLCPGHADHVPALRVALLSVASASLPDGCGCLEPGPSAWGVAVPGPEDKVRAVTWGLEDKG